MLCQDFAKGPFADSGFFGELSLGHKTLAFRISTIEECPYLLGGLRPFCRTLGWKLRLGIGL